MVLGTEGVRVYLEAGSMRVVHQAGGCAERAAGLQRDDRADVRPDRIRIPGDPAQPGRRHHLRIGQLAARRGHVVRLLFPVTEQLQQADVAVPAVGELAAQVFQVADLERLDLHRRAAGVGVRGQRGEQSVLHRQTDLAEIRAVLDFRDDPDHLPACRRFGGDEVDDLVQRGDLELAVVPRAAQLRQPFACAQCLQLGQAEVLAEPAGDLRAIDQLAGLARGELGMTGHVGGAADLVLVARHQHAILRHHQVRLDEVGAVGDRLRIRSQRVLRAQRAGAAMADHQHPGGKRFLGGSGGGRHEYPTENGNGEA